MVDQLAPYRPPRFIAGLDVGQMSDPSALTVLEREMRLWHGQLEPYFFAGHLERIPLQTPYPDMVKGVRQRLEAIGERCALVIDATGVGRGVVDLFREGWTESDPDTLQRIVLPGKPSIIAVTLTNGQQGHAESWDEQYVPKRDVITALLLALQQQRFRAAASLAEIPTLLNEAKNFQWKVSKAGDDLYGQWREGKHDDLLLAVAVAVWYGDKYAPVSVSGQTQAKARGTGNPFVQRARQMAMSGRG